MKTIYTKTHILLVDETVDLFEGDKGLSMDNTRVITIQKDWNNSIKLANKIIAAYPPLKGCYEFETLPPNTEDDVEKLSMDKYPLNYNDGMFNPNNVQKRKDFVKIYTQAKSETMFSLDDMNRAFEAGMKFIGEDKGSFNEFIQSLTKPKEYEFIPKMGLMKLNEDGEEYGFPDMTQPKIVNNKIQGTWKPKSTN